MAAYPLLFFLHRDSGGQTPTSIPNHKHISPSVRKSNAKPSWLPRTTYLGVCNPALFRLKKERASADWSMPRLHDFRSASAFSSLVFACHLDLDTWARLKQVGLENHRFSYGKLDTVTKPRWKLVSQIIKRLKGISRNRVHRFVYQMLIQCAVTSYW